MDGLVGIENLDNLDTLADRLVTEGEDSLASVESTAGSPQCEKPSAQCDKSEKEVLDVNSESPSFVDETSEKPAASNTAKASESSKMSETTDTPETAKITETTEAPETMAAEESFEEATTAPILENLLAANEAGEAGEVESLEESIEMDEAAGLQLELDTLRDELARARADYYNLTQQYTAYVKRSKEEAATHRAIGQSEVCEALLVVLDDIEAARQHGDLESGPLAAIATKLEGILNTRFGLEKFGESGQEFDPNSHEALMAASSSEVQVPMVKEVFQAGYQIKERVLRPAKVAVENPE